MCKEYVVIKRWLMCNHDNVDKTNLSENLTEQSPNVFERFSMKQHWPRVVVFEIAPRSHNKYSSVFMDSAKKIIEAFSVMSLNSSE